MFRFLIVPMLLAFLGASIPSPLQAATLIELAELRSDTRWEGFVRKILASAAKHVVTLTKPPATPDANTLAWSKTYLASPRLQADLIVNYMIGENASATVDQILNAADAAIDANVSEAIDNLLVK